MGQVRTKEVMEMSGSTRQGFAITRTILAGALSIAVIAGLGARPVAAALSDSSLACGEGTETAYFGFPLDSEPRMSIFAYRVNGGGWQWTDWYYMSSGRYWNWSTGQGRWLGLSADVSFKLLMLGNRAFVEGWEYRYDPVRGTEGWINLGSCTTSSFFSGGLVFN
jgi:hypothetical protein